MSWNCVVVARRRRCGIREAIVQWECCWVEEGTLSPGHKVLEVLLRRTVRGQQQALVQWACEWIPVEDCDAGALEDFQEEEVVDDLAMPVDQTLAAVVAGPAKKKKTKRRGW